MMNTELRLHCQHRDNGEGPFTAEDYLWFRNQAMEELNRAFSLYGDLEAHVKQMITIGENDRIKLWALLARIDERLRAPGHRS